MAETRIEVEESEEGFILKIYSSDAAIPTDPALIQKKYPNGDAWGSAKEAEDWAKMFILSIEDHSAPFPPRSRGGEPIPKPTEEELAVMQAEMEEKMKRLLPPDAQI